MSQLQGMAGLPGKEEFSRGLSGTALSVAFYMLCSSLALLSNKVTIYHIPMPASVFCLQICVTLVFLYSAHALRLLEMDAIAWANVKAFLPYIAGFVACLYSNGRALAASNVETVIVFRACSPLCVSVLDWLFLGRELPSLRSALALVGVVAGAAGYVAADSQFALEGARAYVWVTINLASIAFEMTYGKMITSSVLFASKTWGQMLYTNALSLPPMLCLAASTGEQRELGSLTLGVAGTAWLILSCFLGFGISFAGWNCRAQVSATAYTLVGVICKFLSVLLNILIWDKHASPIGLGMLSVCLVASAMYQQAPLRADASKTESTFSTIPTSPAADTIGLQVEEVEARGVEETHSDSSSRKRSPGRCPEQGEKETEPLAEPRQPV